MEIKLISIMMENNMILRKLELKDAPFMLEWMKDDTISRHFNNNFINMRLDDCIKFIRDSDNNKKNIHYAICNNEDQYIGTISLENFDFKNKNAEYAIVVTKKAMGTGIAKEATDAILKIAFDELSLHKVYLCVSEKNKRAISFYEKYGMTREAIFKRHIYQDNQFHDLIWFSCFNESIALKHQTYKME